MKINLGSGTFYKLGLTLKEQRDVISKLDVNGVELCMALENEMDEILNDQEHINFLKKYSTNTFHVPFKDNYFIDEGNYKEKFEKIIHFAKIINAKSIVFHAYNVSSLEILKNFPLTFTVENTISGDWNGQKIINAFKKFPEYNMTLDTSHCYHFGESEFLLLAKNLNDKITQIHLGNVIDGVHHKQFFRGEGQNLKFILSKLKINKKDIILTIEENFNNVEDIQKEIDFIKKTVNEL